MIIFQLYWEFFKTGLFAIGGGMATIPFLSEMADKTGWFTQQQLTDMVAIAESTPGPIGINTATYVGIETAGIAGALSAVIGLMTPSVVIILLIAIFIKNFRQSVSVNHFLSGIRPASTGLIAAVLVSLILSTCFTENWQFGDALSALFRWKHVLILIIILVLSNIKALKNWHPIIWLGLSAAAGILFSL